MCHEDAINNQQCFSFEIPSGPLGAIKNTLLIDGSGVKFNDRFIATNEYEYLIAGMLNITSIVSTTHCSSLSIGGNGKEITVSLNDAYFGKSKRRLYEEVYPIVRDVVGTRIIEKMLESLKNGTPVRIGSATFNKDGVSVVGRNEIAAKLFGVFAPRQKPVFVPYERLFFGMWNGEVKLSDKLHSNLSCLMAIRLVPNACLLIPLCRILTGKQ